VRIPLTQAQHQQLDKSFFGSLPGLFGLFLASAFFQTFFSASLDAFWGLQTTSAFLRGFQGFRGFGLFAFSVASWGFSFLIDFSFSFQRKVKKTILNPCCHREGPCFRVQIQQTVQC
jgi:hypothetical protein